MVGGVPGFGPLTPISAGSLLLTVWIRFLPLHSIFDVLKKTMKSFGVFCASAWTLLLFAAAMPVFASPFSGLTITSIEIQDDHGRPWTAPESVIPLMVVRPGTPFSGESIREGISYLYLTGSFKDIRVDGFRDGEGVRLVYTLFPVTLVSAVEISGNHALSRSAVADAVKGTVGRELREDRFPELRTAIQTRYQSEGYYGTHVAIAARPGREPHQAVLAVTIGEPGRTLVGNVVFTGNTVFSTQQLLRAMKNRPGRPLRTDVLFDQDMAAIVEKYAEAGYPAARPGPVDISFRDEQAFIVISGSEGPRVTVSFSGNRAFSDSDLDEQVLVWSEHDISDAIIDGSADNIRDVFRADGYDAVRVTV
jgi:outer membrane protein assembly factor BamA